MARPEELAPAAQLVPEILLERLAGLVAEAEAEAAEVRALVEIQAALEALEKQAALEALVL